jgi:hypothetical protein
MDPAKFAHTENVSIVRDRVRITLTDGTIQFTQPVNGVVFGAVFHGSGRLQADPPNPIEAQQLRLFTKQDKLDMNFSEATFSFTDGLQQARIYGRFQGHRREAHDTGHESGRHSQDGLVL